MLLSFYFILMRIDECKSRLPTSAPLPLFVEHGEIAKLSIVVKMKLTRNQPVILAWFVFGASETPAHCRVQGHQPTQSFGYISCCSNTAMYITSSFGAGLQVYKGEF